MQKYKDFRPTAFDPHARIECVTDGDDREEWLIAPVSRTRDSGTLDNSNYESALKLFETECSANDFEEHRFGHWGIGWFELILVRPYSSAEERARQIEWALEDYPVLDEIDHAAREHEAAMEAWDNYASNEFRDHIIKTFKPTDEMIDDDLDCAANPHRPGDVLFEIFDASGGQIEYGEEPSFRYGSDAKLQAALEKILEWNFTEEKE